MKKSIEYKMKKNKLLLIGWDAADWKIIGPLLAKGQMPHLKKIIDNGVYGNMATMNPPYSPMLWSSVATGKTPDKHGVLGFIELLPDLEGVRPVSTNSRKSRAVWNILHNKGYKSNLIGWWPSYPAEPINGVVISDKYQKVNSDPKKRKPLDEKAIHPLIEKENFLNLRMFPMEITQAHILPFIPRAAEIDQDEDMLLKPFAKVLSQNVTIQNAVTRLLRTTDWDFTAVYYDLIDHMCHSFMKFRAPKLSKIDQTKFEIYKDVVDGAYRFQDMMLGRKLQLIDENTTVIVMSDHGYESGNKRILKMPKVNAAPAMEHRQFGMFAAMGPNIKKNTKVFGLGLIDVAPTILHHFNLPVGKDMDGNVMREIFKDFREPESIESWEKVKGDFGEVDKTVEGEALSDQEAMEQLIELGYIDKPDIDKNKMIIKTKCELKHNLATVYLGLNQHEKAKEILLELLQEKDTVDISVYYKDLIKISLTKENYSEAKKYLQSLKKVKTEVKYNLFFIESEILDGEGRTKEALNILTSVISSRGYMPELWNKIGALQYKLGDYKFAEDSFEKAISLESDNATYHRNLAETYYSLKNYEEAVDSALTSIELVRNFPAAHFILAQSLEKLGDLENAKKAYLTAASLNNNLKEKENQAIENIEEKLKQVKLNDKTDYKYRDNQITVVSGLPRSGTSMMMQMLSNGGLNPLVDNKREADKSNPKGYFEYEPVMGIHKDNSWLGKARNKSVKIVAPLLKYIDTKYRYKIIFMKRDLNEVIKSQLIMTKKNPDIFPVKIHNSYVRLLNNIENWKEKEPGVEIIYVDYKEIIENPEENIEKIESFLGIDLERSKMETAIDKSLYRNRSKETEKTK
ncbi:alkaline phosphatase family protein [Patiriisocius hiemis]|uniref:Alkaline phosphatase family protein n=1 Tax=Patiriisocius hiemis TaxID=3075604 RepID=A0ABU2YCP4_9FLAO|nr:alkaline phosphatase family protein [Constantimarinum sp. W242]MDT0555777.1 alkaline phosphatase family protein [Constantimarinum sp. W242]